MGQQGVQPHREVPSAASGSQLGVKRVFFLRYLLQELQVEKYNSSVGCRRDFFLPSSKSARLGHPFVPEI